MHHPLTARREAPPNGVVETLSAGYLAVNRQLWVLLLPILVDLFLWVGPHVSYAPLVDPALTRATAWLRHVDAAPGRGAQDPELARELDDLRQSLMTRTNETNALILVARGPLALPSVAALLGGVGVLSFVPSWPAGLALLGGCLAGGLLLGGLFYALLAQQVRGGSPGNPLAAAGRRLPRDVARVVGLSALVAGFGLLLGLPLLLMVGLTALVAPAVASLGLAGVFLALLVAGVYLSFALDAIFVSGVGPLAAVQRSVGVVRRHPWPTLGLILLTWLIVAGMDQVWGLLVTRVRAPFGVGLGMLGNAYIASGLVAASMIFYKERADPSRGGGVTEGSDGRADSVNRRKGGRGEGRQPS